MRAAKYTVRSDSFDEVRFSLYADSDGWLEAWFYGPDDKTCCTPLTVPQAQALRTYFVQHVTAQSQKSETIGALRLTDESDENGEAIGIMDENESIRFPMDDAADNREILAALEEWVSWAEHHAPRTEHTQARQDRDMGEGRA